ncbi:MAG TPA: helix-turn-helix transcriptional regulator [Actinophytocola sp.]|jgi:transcriptional regulator with XRE-family HTH domain|nr:helix-turn-helix transcriptional regulator [Actinophytocola sp.]
MGRANATACYRELGAELRKRREAARVTTAMIAEETGWDRSKISRMETGNINISTVDLIFYLGACGLHRWEGREELLEFCNTAAAGLGYWLSPRGEWLEDSLASLIFHESTADRTISYEPFVVPGLLQTSAYARERIALSAAHTSRDLDEARRIRERRKEILHRPHPAEFVFYVHEQALRTQVGSAQVMHEQMLHVVLMAALRHVTLRIVPAAAHSILGGPFRLFEHPKHAPLLYLDGFLTGVFVEGHDVVGDYYRHMLPELRAVALGAGESREFAAILADEYDRGSLPDVHMEEEQL